ncbi:MAG: S41 family peptidase [Candidatus Zixiibacteriota bacterium]|nr:MAG: S41 family peptidase [candidate division Zixibacteria bacterium]
MVRYTIQLFGITVFALALIWLVGSGEAVQSSKSTGPVLWADTLHINVDEGSSKEDADKKIRDTFLADVKKLTQTAFNIRNQYMEEVDTKEIIKAGIEGMLEDLDRFSVLMEKQSYDALMESTHGKYEGLGMQIDSRGNRIVIITPIEGTPAYRKGLRAGDVIYEIDGKDTEGMSSSDASGMMRGKAGTSVVLTIKRAGIKDLLEFEIERAVIELRSVNYYGVVPGSDIGYLRLSRFAEETSHELREAIIALNEQNISSLIFDLRNNGGGLLDQAKETAELFLDKGREIVYTKGRLENSERHYYSERDPIFAGQKPLVILVDEGTASASEIVAGAVQDWDRGLIVGSNTYGKGLVQQIFNISTDGSMALKLTTAKYYVPSGRCIQKADRQQKGSSALLPENHPDTTAPGAEGEATEEDSLKVPDKEIYYTNGGRVVYGGGGIIPDIDVEGETWKPIEINLERKSLFFDFAVEYVSQHPDVKPELEITDDILSQFREFIQEKDFDYQTSLQLALKRLENEVKDEGEEEMFAESLEAMRALVEKEKEDDFDESVDYIRRTIKREIVASIAGERGVYEEIVLKTDKTVAKAIEILSNPDRYSQLLVKGQNKAEL